MSGLQDEIARRHAEGQGEYRIARDLKITRHQARVGILKVMQQPAPAMAASGSALVKYDAACRALADAKTFDEVRAISEEMEHVKLYGRRVKDRDLIAEATEVQTRAERRLGELLLEAEKRGWIGRGRPKENVPNSEHFTLEEAGIDRKLSSRAQQLAEVPQAEFEQAVEKVRERIVSGEATLVNGARAVMASRQQARGDLDFAPTPPWATRTLIEVVLPQIQDVDFAIPEQSAWESACGAGHMAEVLAEYYGAVTATDLSESYGYGQAPLDFLAPDLPDDLGADWIITNPPFEERAHAFALRALERANVGVAIFAQLRWLETIGRYEQLFRDQPPTLLAFFVERVNLCMGRWDPEGGTATAYMWVVWVKGRQPQAPFWIPPGQRERLTKPDDAERFTQHPVRRLNNENAAAHAVATAPEPASAYAPQPQVLAGSLNLVGGS